MPRLSEAQQHSAVARKMCLFVAAVDRLSPLLDGEFKRSDDFCTLLTHDAGPCAKGTPAMVRDTNHATLHDVFRNVAVDAETGAVSYRSTPMLMATDDTTPETERHVKAWMQANLATATALLGVLIPSAAASTTGS